MPARKANAKWNGTVKEGKGELELASGAWKGSYDFRSRFEEGSTTNPEELIAAAHAGCFSMALSAALGRNNTPPDEVRTTATVHLRMGDGGPEIWKIDLVTRARVPGVDAAKFAEIANGAKVNCPVSKALKAVEITLDAALE